jgi:hypothetical protein
MAVSAHRAFMAGMYRDVPVDAMKLHPKQECIDFAVETAAFHVQDLPRQLFAYETESRRVLEGSEYSTTSSAKAYQDWSLGSSSQDSDSDGNNKNTSHAKKKGGRRGRHRHPHHRHQLHHNQLTNDATATTPALDTHSQANLPADNKEAKVKTPASDLAAMLNKMQKGFNRKMRRRHRQAQVEGLQRNLRRGKMGVMAASAAATGADQPVLNNGNDDDEDDEDGDDDGEDDNDPDEEGKGTELEEKPDTKASLPVDVEVIEPTRDTEGASVSLSVDNSEFISHSQSLDESDDDLGSVMSLQDMAIREMTTRPTATIGLGAAVDPLEGVSKSPGAVSVNRQRKLAIAADLLERVDDPSTDEPAYPIYARPPRRERSLAGSVQSVASAKSHFDTDEMTTQQYFVSETETVNVCAAKGSIAVRPAPEPYLEIDLTGIYIRNKQKQLAVGVVKDYGSIVQRIKMDKIGGVPRGALLPVENTKKGPIGEAVFNRTVVEKTMTALEVKALEVRYLHIYV